MFVHFKACMPATGGIVQASAFGAVKALCLLLYRYDQILLFFLGGRQPGCMELVVGEWFNEQTIKGQCFVCTVGF